MREPEPADTGGFNKRDMASSQRTGTMDAGQYTLRLKQPEFARNRVMDWLRSLAMPLMNIAKPHFRQFFHSFEGKGTEARKVRVNGTRILVAVLGDSKELISEAETDAAKYAVYYKHLEQRKSLNAQEFLVLLSTENFDIVHLHGQFDKRAIIKDSTGFSLRLSDIKRACDYADVKLLWLSSANKPEWLKGNEVLDKPSFAIALTGSRGNAFPKFLSSILSRLSRGDNLNNAWEQVLPGSQSRGQRVDVKLVPGPAEISFLP
jgi:hypothetical protein